jgi:hypothetical protein
LRHAYSRNGYERDNIRCAYSGVHATVTPEVDQFSSFFYGFECRYYHGFRVARERHHAAVVIRISVQIEQFHALHASGHSRNGLDFSLIPAFAEIGDAL